MKNYARKSYGTPYQNRTMDLLLEIRTGLITIQNTQIKDGQEWL